MLRTMDIHTISKHINSYKEENKFRRKIKKLLKLTLIHSKMLGHVKISLVRESIVSKFFLRDRGWLLWEWKRPSSGPN